MADGFTILVADRNRHVRNFLRRELSTEGYQVEVAVDGRDILRKIGMAAPPDLLILDLEMSYGAGLELLERLHRTSPRLPIIIHTLLTEYESHPAAQHAAAFVEKKGNTDRLKAVVGEVLKRTYPDRGASKGKVLSEGEGDRTMD